MSMEKSVPSQKKSPPKQKVDTVLAKVATEPGKVIDVPGKLGAESRIDTNEQKKSGKSTPTREKS